MPAAETYFIVWKGRRDGPYTLDQLADLLKRGDIGLLHRVETPAGLVPLKQLLPAPAEPSSAPAEIISPPPEMTPRPAVPAENLAQDEAMRAYTTCGLCFVLPPLAYRTWLRARDLAAQGYPQTAQRLQWLSAGLGAGGLVFWLILGWLFFSRR
jgi:hypothetical protein